MKACSIRLSDYLIFLKLLYTNASFALQHLPKNYLIGIDVYSFSSIVLFQRESTTPSKMRPASTLGFSLSAIDFSTSNNTQQLDKSGAPKRDSAGGEL